MHQYVVEGVRQADLGTVMAIVQPVGLSADHQQDALKYLAKILAYAKGDV